MNTVHAHDSEVVPSLTDDNIEDDDLPSMAVDGTELPTPEDTTSLAPTSIASLAPSRVSSKHIPTETTTTVISPPRSHLPSPASDRTGNLTSPAHFRCTSPEFSSKASWLETVIKKIT